MKNIVVIGADFDESMTAARRMQIIANELRNSPQSGLIVILKERNGETHDETAHLCEKLLRGNQAFDQEVEQED